ncbi:MAG: hypothetical protein GY861_11550, partial [bacterium]|nr:hypothetical protein [bacterium]
MKKLLLIILALVLLGVNAWGAVTVGIFTDSHYDLADYPERGTIAYNTITSLEVAGATLAFSLGDTYNDALNVTEARSNIVAYETIWNTFSGDTYFVIGNHDYANLTEAIFVSESNLTPALNFTINQGTWHFVCYDNVSAPYTSASTSTLTWLETELEKYET